MVGSGVCELTNQRILGTWEGGLKDTGAKTEHLRLMGNTVLQFKTLLLHYLNIKACKTIVVVKQIKTINL